MTQELLQAGNDVRCVLWHAGGASVSADLLTALERPGFGIVRCENEFAALAELVKPAAPGTAVVLLLDRPQTLRGVSDLTALLPRYAPRTNIWVYEEAPRPKLRAMTEADAQSWKAAAPAPQPAPRRETPRAVAVTEPKLALARPADSDAARPEPGAAPTAPVMRLTGVDDRATPPKHARSELDPPAEPLPDHPSGMLRLMPGEGSPKDARSGAADHLLTDEELAMLLALDGDEGHSDNRQEA